MELPSPSQIERAEKLFKGNEKLIFNYKNIVFHVRKYEGRYLCFRDSESALVPRNHIHYNYETGQFCPDVAGTDFTVEEAVKMWKIFYMEKVV